MKLTLDDWIKLIDAGCAVEVYLDGVRVSDAGVPLVEADDEAGTVTRYTNPNGLDLATTTQQGHVQIRVIRPIGVQVEETIRTNDRSG